MRTPTYQPLVHRTAVATTVAALLPIAVGAVVTTMKWGMAFRDWPTSDGRNMLAYPWLADFVRGAMDRFTEHGHRLAGMLIGVMCIGLTVVVWRREGRLWVRLLAAGVLLGVIVQGLLGGARVLGDDPRMAMLHGNFAAIVFCLMATVSLVTSRRWLQARPASGGRRPAVVDASSLGILKPLALCTMFAVYAQFILGGRLRHLGDMLHEHLAGAVLAGLMVLATAVAAYRSKDRWLGSAGGWMLLFLLLQVGLGAGAWITKFGLAATGYVAAHGSPTQMIVRSSHTVVGMLLLMTSLMMSLRVLRVGAASRGTIARPVSTSAIAGALSTEGGAG
ncbi:MAG: heme A synthase [Planctomycetaceae bacterium]